MADPPSAPRAGGLPIMKILHVLPSLDPAAGGPPRIALHLATATARLGLAA